MTEPFEAYSASDDRYSAPPSIFVGEEEPSLPPEDVHETLRRDARREASAWKLSSHRGRCRVLGAKARDAQRRISSALDPWARDGRGAAASPAALWLTENARLLRTALDEARESAQTTKTLPQVEASGEGAARLPRPYLVAAGFLRAVDYAFSEESLLVYARAAQEDSKFEIGEIWALKTMAQLVLLEAVGRAAQSEHREHDEIARTITSLRRVGEADWKELFEELSETESILRQDPARAYPRMDFESRELYRGALQELAARSELDESTIARRALELARANYNAWSSNSRLQQRRGHVGYYLVDRGRPFLERRINFHASFAQQIRSTVLESPEVFYFVGIELLTLGMIAFALSGVQSDVPLALAVLFFLLPATESGIGIMNQLVAALLPPRPLPKLDFSSGIPASCATMVTIPTLLIGERQVRQLVADLETRYFGNRDPNLHFALLTDAPDSPGPYGGKGRLVELCSELIRDLNDRHANEGYGGFFLFHRRHLYNASEGAWMGWERKRGKLVDFNNLLRGKFDSFPVKVGDLSVLPGIQYVLTLDSDTQLPRDSAHRLIGTLAHPLNRAVISPSKNTVIEGYGVLQPRVGISVRSAGRSRLASIYSGQTGFDIYTRATSDVYQDLFREGIFTGKGIYEVDVFQQVLGERFPSNAILSHDLIEGAYARAGLVTDTEVIDDYPSHFSAYSRRKHRWVRGDWQILRWLLPRVPTYSGKMVPNPLGVVSRWKILDNLRRSLIELATFLLLLAAWFFLPGSPGHWTVAILVLMLLPSYAQLLLALPRVVGSENSWAYLQEVAGTFVTAQINVLLWFIFLAHQTLVTLDAVVRTLVRLTVTHRNLLEWETAAESETAARKKTPVDLYMDWMPAVAIGLGVALALYRPHALRDALPFFALWGLSKPLSRWLDRPLVSARRGMTARDRVFLREAALRTWRFFRSCACEDDHGLVPDNVQETPVAVAHRLSPTNLGLLLDARLAAHELGFLTLPGFFAATRQTLSTAQRLRRFQGHFFNWYDTRTLEPLDPLFISSVDSGNLAACLWTLKQGCLKAIHQPLVRPGLCRAVREHWNLAVDSARAQVLRQDLMDAMERVSLRMIPLGDDVRAWLGCLPALEPEIAALDETLARDGAPRLRDAAWWVAETRLKVRQLRQLAEAFVPWLLPESVTLLGRLAASPGSSGLPGADLTLELLPRAAADLDSRLEQASRSETLDAPSTAAVDQLRRSLHGCVSEADHLREGIEALAEDCDRLVNEMDFRFLYQPRRKVLSVGYDVSRQHLEESCYELLASEARTAAFVAIAKGDVPQQSWLHLGRSHTVCRRNRVLLSWTGTMFEYLMPALWMRSSPLTILDQSMRAAVACQRKAFERTGLPWGISESACSDRNQDGHYQYRAFGLPELALRPSLPENMVVSSYSGFLALLVDPAGATDNLRLMRDTGWIGSLGFYESAEVKGAAHTSGSARVAPTLELVRCWMAHHQGMSLLSLANVLADSCIQCLFHAEPQVMATERLLQERVPAAIVVEPNDLPAGRLAARRWLPSVRPQKTS